MPRTSITPIQTTGAFVTASVALTWTASDVANMNQFAITGRELLLIRNVNAAAQTWTATSAPDPYGRTQNITNESLATNTFRVYGPTDLVGWKQADGMFYFQGNHADIQFAVIRF